MTRSSAPEAGFDKPDERPAFGLGVLPTSRQMLAEWS